MIDPANRRKPWSDGVSPWLVPALLSALILGTGPARAQTAPAPQVSVTIAPDGPVTVGIPVEISVTLLVPTYLPNPPRWPDLQIADAITRLPDRATHPVTRRVGDASWSGLVRTWQIIPQRAADYDLGTARIDVTYADPDTNAARETTLYIPDIAFSATVPAGAEGIDPFLAATGLTVTARLDGLPDKPKPGDAFTLTLTTTAAGPPAMLLPPLSGRLPTYSGLRAYPRQPSATDAPGDPPTATRTEEIAYVIEAPGSYAIPALSLDWWNTATRSRETAASDPLPIDVPASPGWRPPDAGGAPASRRLDWIALASVAALALVAAVLTRRRRRRSQRPSLRTLHRALRKAARSEPPGVIRQRLAAWKAALPEPPPPPAASAAIETALRALERQTYGPSVPATPDQAARRALLAEIDAISRAPVAPARQLPALNP